MIPLKELVGKELIWTQPKALKMEYELRSGAELVGRLRFRSSLGSFATAECAEGCWTFKRVGFWQTHATVRECGSETDLAVFRNDTWSSGGALELPGGRKYPATSNFWATEYEFQTEDGVALIRYKIHGVLHLSSQVEILPPASGLDEMPWMVLFGWYLVIMMYQDSAAAAAATSGAIY